MSTTFDYTVDSTEAFHAVYAEMRRMHENTRLDVLDGTLDAELDADADMADYLHLPVVVLDAYKRWIVALTARVLSESDDGCDHLKNLGREYRRVLRAIDMKARYNL